MKKYMRENKEKGTIMHNNVYLNPSLLRKEDMHNDYNKSKNVFLSWSGQKSKKVAEALSVFLRKAFSDNIDIFFSREMLPGESWGEKIKRELNRANIGIILLTNDNINKPWPMFEAGAIHLSSPIIPVLYGRRQDKVESPLEKYQHLVLLDAEHQADIANPSLLQLLYAINKHLNLNIPDTLLEYFTRHEDTDFFKSIKIAKDEVLADFVLDIQELTKSAIRISELSNRDGYDIIIGMNHGGTSMANNMATYLTCNHEALMGFVHFDRDGKKYTERKNTYLPQFKTSDKSYEVNILVLDAKYKSGKGFEALVLLLLNKYGKNINIDLGVALYYMRKSADNEEYERLSEQQKVEVKICYKEVDRKYIIGESSNDSININLYYNYFTRVNRNQTPDMIKEELRKSYRNEEVKQ